MDVALKARSLTSSNKSWGCSMTTQTHNPQIFPKNDNQFFFKKYNTHPFPEGDTSYLDLFDINRYKKKYWLYKCSSTKQIVKGVIRHVNKDGSKRIFQFSYDGKEFINQTKHITNCPLYKADELAELDRDHQIDLSEGEKTADAMQELFQDSFCLTWSGGCKNWRKTDWSDLKGFTNVRISPDADKGGVDAAEDIALFLNENYGIAAKVVNLPETLEVGWDWADKIPSNINPRALLESASVPPPKSGWEDIDDDIRRGRWVYISDSLKLYWDRFQQKMMKEQNINLLYKRNRNRLRVTPVSYLHEQGIEVVDGTAFYPIDKEIITFGEGVHKRTYLNTYKPLDLSPLSKTEADNFDMDFIQPMRDHMLNVLCDGNQGTFNYLEDTLSFDFQHPEKNRTFAWIFSSKQGVGKSLFFNLLTNLHGSRNVAQVHTDNLVDKYRSYMKNCFIIICNEIDISGQGKSAKLDKLKELITEEVHPIEQKYVDTINHRGHYRLWASSNKNIPLTLDASDRRITFVNIATSREQLFEKNPNYFVDLWSNVEDEYFLRCFLHYYKNIRKISDDFNPHEPFRTASREELMDVSKPQAFKDLDDRLLKRKGVLDRDIVSSRDILNELRAEDDRRTSIDKERPRYDKIDEIVIHRWLETIGAKPIWNNQPVSLIGDKKTNRKRYKAIRHVDFWVACSEITYMRAHMRYKFEVGQDTPVAELAISIKNFAQGGHGVLANKDGVPFVSTNPHDVY